MTGFGANEFRFGTSKGTVEIKSLNHRYLDISYFLPLGFTSVENKIRDIIAGQIERGKITVVVRLSGKPTPTVGFNKSVVRTYLKQGQMLKKEFGLKGDLALANLISLPGVVEIKETLLGPEELWPMIEQGFKKALASLLLMRKREGMSLVRDINSLLSRMRIRIRKIQQRAQTVLKEQKKILTDEEFSAFQKGSDVNEEIARLIHHIDELKALVKTDVPAGKKLDFIAQEMQRETNTIGAKLQDKLVSNAVIALKSKIEKIREHSQNIE